MQYYTSQSGYSLVEVLVSISVLLIATVGPMAIATQGLKSAQFTLEQNTAYFLAQEGLEVIFKLRNDAALEDIEDGLGGSDPDTSWDWINWPGRSGRIANQIVCSGMSSSESCKVGAYFKDNDIQLRSCNTNISNCKVYINESDLRAIYSHESSGGTETPFTRVITITRESNYSIKVESRVTWDSSVFNGEREVVATTNLFDSNFE